jgi:hypothetical protein
MIQICYSTFHIGDRKFGEKEPLSDKRATHGICNTCFPKEMEMVRAAIKKHKEAWGRGDNPITQ